MNLDAQKEKHIPTKKIVDHIYGTTVGEVDHLTVTVDQRSGKINFGPNVVGTYSERSYDRPKGPKVITRVPQSDQGMRFDNDTALEKHYDRVFCIDANYYDIDGTKTAATGVVSLHRNVVIGPKNVDKGWRISSPVAAVFSEPTINPEKLGWMFGIEELHRTGEIRAGERIGIIVDSFLGDLNAFNDRSRAIEGQWYLPPNLVLLYASADASKSDVMNWAIGAADSLAKQCLQKFSAGDFDFDPNLMGEYFTAARFIQPDLVEP